VKKESIMKVLFVYRFVGSQARNSVVDAQAESLKESGIDLHMYPIKKGGIRGYFNAYCVLKRFLRENHFDIVHGHYSFSSMVASLAFKGKTIASLMGSDVYIRNFFIRLITNFFVKFFWIKTIVKSEKMRRKIRNSIIIPNGVNFNIFKFIDKKAALKKARFENAKKNIIFVAEDIYTKVKNFKLARKAVKLLNNPDVILHGVSDCNQEDLVYYYNAADLLLLTSYSEGSPNVIKEAMACNCPIVSTDVGDVRELIGDTKGCYITSFEPEDVAQKIQQALDFGQRTTGREYIRHLDAKLIARKIIDIYTELIDDCNC
jgi:teichuronic acid biosynthesis glycosyltransferase TuaC